MCLIPRSDEFEDQGHQGQKRYFSPLSAACVWFMFGKNIFNLWSFSLSSSVTVREYLAVCLRSANNFAMQHKRKTITGQDVLDAMKEMEFERFVEPLKRSLEGAWHLCDVLLLRAV